MDNETKEMLQLILSKMTSLEEGQQRIDQRLDKLETDVKEVKRTVKKTAYQVDTLYDWVDGIDLKVKSNTDILNNLPLAK